MKKVLMIEARSRKSFSSEIVELRNLDIQGA
jgi:hypothetical protein